MQQRSIIHRQDAEACWRHLGIGDELLYVVKKLLSVSHRSNIIWKNPTLQLDISNGTCKLWNIKTGGMVKAKKPVPPQVQRLFDRIKALGKSRAGVLRECGLANSTFNDWIDGSTPSVDHLDKVLAAVFWTRADYDGDTPKVGIRLTPTFEIVGGEMFAPARGKPKDFSLSLLSNEDLVSLEVTTDAYKPRYRLGDIVAGPRQQRNFHNLVGSDCIAEGKDGKKYFKKLGKRDAKGRYTLKSFDEDTEDVPGVEIKWLAPIKIIYRP